MKNDLTCVLMLAIVLKCSAARVCFVCDDCQEPMNLRYCGGEKFNCVVQFEKRNDSKEERVAVNRFCEISRTLQYNKKVSKSNDTCKVQTVMKSVEFNDDLSKELYRKFQNKIEGNVTLERKFQKFLKRGQRGSKKFEYRSKSLKCSCDTNACNNNHLLIQHIYENIILLEM